MFYVQKVGVYIQGVFWIGRSKSAAIKKANELAASDVDNYHEWEVLKYKTGSCETGFYKPVYSITGKSEAERQKEADSKKVSKRVISEGGEITFIMVNPD